MRWTKGMLLRHQPDNERITILLLTLSCELQLNFVIMYSSRVPMHQFNEATFSGTRLIDWLTTEYHKGTLTIIKDMSTSIERNMNE